MSFKWLQSVIMGNSWGKKGLSLTSSKQRLVILKKLWPIKTTYLETTQLCKSWSTLENSKCWKILIFHSWSSCLTIFCQKFWFSQFWLKSFNPFDMLFQNFKFTYIISYQSWITEFEPKPLLKKIGFSSQIFIILNKLPDFDKFSPVGIYLLKVNKRNTRTRCEICSKLTIKTPKRR